MQPTKPVANQPPTNTAPSTPPAAAGASTKNAEASILLRLFSSFAVFSALVYAIGYLVDFTFMNSMGIKDSVTDAFKAKYIYIGLLCLIFPSSAVTIVVGVSRLRRSVGDRKTPADKLRYRMYPFVAGLFLVFLLAFYVLIGVARPNTFADHEAAFSLLFVVGAMAPSLLHLLQMRLLRIAERANQPHPNQITTPRATSWRSKISQNFTRLWKTFSVVHLPKIAAKIISSNLITWVFAMLVVVSLALTWIIFRDLWPMIRELLQEGGYLHFGLIAFAGFLAWRLDRTTTRRVAESPGTIAPATLITGTIIAALSILSVIFFAGRVYCFIPVYKGGGDFTTETTAVLLFDPKFTNSLPPELKIVGGRSTNLYIVYQNNSSFFLAVPTASNNPTTWRHVGHTNKPSKIYSIRKESVISYEFGQSH